MCALKDPDRNARAHVFLVPNRYLNDKKLYKETVR